jgi:hypothetical protein
MVTHSIASFAGYDCVKLENEALALWITRSVGPRIIGLALQGGESLFAVLPDDKTKRPDGSIFSFRGGHRLWYAPEDLHITYIPDDDPVGIDEVQDGLIVTQPVQAQTGIQKSLTITLPGQDACVIIDHTLRNESSHPAELAPWAITQFKPGGVGILPQVTGPVDEHGLLPNRQIALWPYTQIDSPHITWGDRFVFVEATMQDGPLGKQSGALKIGFPNPIGWLAYAVDDTLFVKYAEYRPQAAYFDRESSSECYCNPRFLELETLGPRTTLAPGASVTHRETWVVYAGVSVQADEVAVEKLVKELGLTEGTAS